MSRGDLAPAVGLIADPHATALWPDASSAWKSGAPLFTRALVKKKVGPSAVKVVPKEDG